MNIDDRAHLALARARLAEGAPLTIVDGSQIWQASQHSPADTGATRLLITAERAVALGLSDSDCATGVLAYASTAALHVQVADALVDPACIKLPEPQDHPTAGTLNRALPPSFAAGLIRLVKSAGGLPALFFTASDDTGPNARQSISGDVLRAYADTDYSTAQRMASAPLPTRDSEAARLIRYCDFTDGTGEHLAMVYGDISSAEPTLVRVHSKCATGDLFASRRCDCGEQLAAARAQLGAEGGVLLYLDQEGRGIGLNNKLHAYRLQDQGLDTFEANHQLGFEDDERNFQLATDILRDIGVRRVRLLTNNPEKVNGLASRSLEVVERLPLIAPNDSARDAYLAAKKRSGHLL